MVKMSRRTHSVACEAAAATGCSRYACEKTGGVGLDCGEAFVDCLRKNKTKKQTKKTKKKTTNQLESIEDAQER